MSVESMSLVFNHSRAKGTAKLVLLGIANHDGDGGSWPAVATLATYANASERSVQAHLATLVDMGELRVHYNEGGTHKTRSDRRPNRYEILVKPPVDNSSDGVQDSTPRAVHGVKDNVERGAGLRSHGVQDPAPEPSLNYPEPAAAAGRHMPVDILPAEVQQLRGAFARTESLRNVSFAWIPAATANLIGQMVARHGVERLVQAVQNTARPPRRVQAFMADWDALGVPLSIVQPPTEPRCQICSSPQSACERASRMVAESDRHEFSA